MEEIKFQYYRSDIKSSEYAGWVTLEQFLYAQMEPKPHIIKLFDEIRQCAIDGDNERKSKLKEKLYSFTPCVHVSQYRRNVDIVKFTGLLVLDFDKIDNAADFKEYLFDEYKSILACWLSPSRKGVKALVKIPVVETKEQFKEYFFGIAAEMWNYNGFDHSSQNCVLPLFQSIDNELLYRDNPTTWEIKGFKECDYDEATGELSEVITTQVTIDKVKAIIDKAFDKIVDNGHPQVRGLCLAVGGFIANKYITYADAFDYIKYKIDNNKYLRKGPDGYKLTAKWALNVGKNKPLSL